MPEIELVHGDITEERVDAVVTAANSALSGGGGVDGAIHRAAGPELARAAQALGRCPAGEAVATPAFRLDPPVRFVIHAVGPVWQGGDHGEAELLESCYRRSLQVADEIGARGIAFPAISTGVFRFPAGQAARIAVRTLRSTRTAVELIRLVAFDRTTYTVLRTALAE